MEKMFIISDDAKLYNFVNSASKYGDYLDNIEFINVTSGNNIVGRNSCVIIDKDNYELDVLRLFAKKMYIILCTENDKAIQIDIEEDNKILVIQKPYIEEQIYCAIKILLEYKELENELYKNKNAETDVRKAAETDYLTGLPNRRGMYEYFGWKLKSETVHCMFIDIDNFKKVNDTYGHKMGDKLLVKVSHMVKEKIGDPFFARLSGDEFAIIINGNTPKEQVINMAEEIIGSADEIEMSVDVSSIISFSIGIMFDQSSGDDLDDILLKCDVAMYQAKKNGKSKYIIYNDIEKQVAYKMSVDRDKYSALNSGQFKIYLQPRMNMVTSGMDGAEAGIYWEHPKDGLRKPDDFIDILEEDGFIVELEMQMFEELCKIVSNWKNTSLETLNVYMRMSAKHLYGKKFVNKIVDIVRFYGLRPERFCIGLTEIESHPRVQESVTEIKKAGFEISCTKGMLNNKSALLNANDSMADEWIIERNLIKGAGSNRTDAIMVKSIISLARELNIQVISRGIDTKKEVDYITGYGCDVGVGSYFGNPLKPVNFYEYALDNISVRKNTYEYIFDGKLTDQNGENEGRFIGSGCEFVEDKELGRKVVRFPGNNIVALENTLELPSQLLSGKNYTISLIVKVEKMKLWQAVFYVECSNGFSSIMPYAWDGVVMFRVKDAMYEDEWHDAIGQEINENKWYYITATYNSKKQESRLYINGNLSATRKDVHIIENPLRVVVGGDIYQGTFKGEVGGIIIHDYVISSEEARKEYMHYIGSICDKGKQ